MRILSGEEESEAIMFMNEAAVYARKATCLKRKCGSVVVKDREIIGEGFNSPPGNLESQRRCGIDKSSYDRKVTDKTCCIHAEERAIFDALKKNSPKVEGSTLYFVSVDENGKTQRAGKPYCTGCSKRALEAGIKHFALWHEAGICVYDTEEYNDISFEYKE